MDKYYYLISQMPTLLFAQELPITRRYFLEQSRKWLDKDDYDCMVQANINEFALLRNIPSSILVNFRVFEYRLRQELVLWRKARKEGHEYKSIMFPSSLLKEGNPLEKERNLLKFRWQFIEEQEIGHSFDLDAVVAYFLKLQILERYFLFEKEKGREKFQSLSRISSEDNKSEVN
jgi:hypothetical protein